MDLRTFLRPEPVPLQSIPALGTPAPATPQLTVAAGRPCVIAFLRHVGCPFAEATFRRLTPLSQAYPAVEFVAVSHATAAATASWCGTLGGMAGVRIVVDTDRTIYAAWGLGLTDARHFLGARSLAAVARLAASAIATPAAPAGRRLAPSRWTRRVSCAGGTSRRTRATCPISTQRSRCWRCGTYRHTIHES